MKKLLFALLLFSPIAYAQNYPPPPNTGLLAARPLSCLNTGQQYYATDNSTLYYSTATGNPCTWTTVGGSGSSASVVPNAQPQFAAYTFYPGTTCTAPTIVGTTICARNNSTGVVDYSGTDAAVVINSAIGNISTTCGKLYFKNGDYKFNSATLETGGGYSNYYYAVRFPANNGTSQTYCQWIVEGEQSGVIGALATAQTTGVIFDVTAAARTAAGAGHTLNAWWAQPDPAGILGPDVFFKNVETRFPDNQRGNEAAYQMIEAGTVDYENVIASLNETMGTPAAPTISPAVSTGTRMIGFSSTKNAHNNWQHFKETWAVGYDIGYDIESEHAVLDSVSGIFLNYEVYYGRVSYGSTIVHPGIWLKVTDEENINGVVLGTAMAPGSEFDIFGYDIELANGISNSAFNRVNNFTETNPGYTSGIITYQVVTEGSGAANVNNLWSAGGQNFQMSQANTRVQYQNAVMVDSFAGPNASILNPGWISCTAVACGSGAGGSILGVNANTATPQTGNANFPASAFEGQSFNADQFSKATVTGINAADVVAVTVRVPGGASGFPTTRTFYEYVCSTSGGAVTNRSIYKIVNSVATLLEQTAGASGCATNDVIELDVAGTYLWAYYNGTLDLPPVSDSSITAGYPGIQVGSNVTNRSSLGSWSGGGLPTKTGSDSVYGQPGSWTKPQTFVSQLTLGAVGTNGVLGLSGTTSGTATITAPSVAGTVANPVVSSNEFQIPGLINTTTPIRDTSEFVLVSNMTGVATAGVNIGSTGASNSTFSWPVTAANWYNMQCKLPVTFAASATLKLQLVSISGSVTISNVNADTMGNTGASAVFQDLATIGGTTLATSVTPVTGAPGASEMVTYTSQFLTSHAGNIGLEFIANGTNNITMLLGGQCGLTQIN